MKIKKILFICSIYTPNVGGIETTVNFLTNFCFKNDIEPIVLTKKYPESLTEKEIINGVKVFRFDRPKTDKEFDDYINFINKYENELKSDIIHLIGVRRPMPLCSLILSKKWQVPVVMTFAGGDLPNPTDQESCQIWKEGQGTVIEAVQQADGLTTFSRSTKELAYRSINDLKEITIFYAGVDLEKINQSAQLKLKNKYFFVARRLFKSKGIDILIKAFANISDQINETKLIIAGDGPEMENLKLLSSKLKMNDNIVFLGTITATKMYSYMKGALACICPSRNEGGGIVNFEAQASGSLAIGSNIGGIPEYIDDQVTGILVPSEDINELSKALLFASFNIDQKNEIKKQAKKNIKKYSWQSFFNNYMLYYNNQIKNYFYKPLKPWSKLTNKLLKII